MKFNIKAVFLKCEMEKLSKNIGQLLQKNVDNEAYLSSVKNDISKNKTKIEHLNFLYDLLKKEHDKMKKELNEKNETKKI